MFHQTFYEKVTIKSQEKFFKHTGVFPRLLISTEVPSAQFLRVQKTKTHEVRSAIRYWECDLQVLTLELRKFC